MSAELVEQLDSLNHTKQTLEDLSEALAAAAISDDGAHAKGVCGLAAEILEAEVANLTAVINSVKM